MRVVLAILICCLLGSCGYQLAGQGGSLSGQPAKVFVPHVVNQTAEPFIETSLTRQISREVARHRDYVEVGGEAAADLKLAVVIKGYQNAALSYDGNDDIAEYRVVMTVQVLLTSLADKSLVWSSQLSWRAAYSAADDKMNQSDKESAAVDEICQRLAEEIVFQLQKGARSSS